jgi:hypothetical protein
MNGGTAFWVTLTNIVLGVLVIAAVLYVVSGPFRDFLSQLKKRRAIEAELNHDMKEMFADVSRPATPDRFSFLHKLLRELSRAWRRVADRR